MALHSEADGRKIREIRETRKIRKEDLVENLQVLALQLLVFNRLAQLSKIVEYYHIKLDLGGETKLHFELLSECISMVSFFMFDFFVEEN